MKKIGIISLALYLAANISACVEFQTPVLMKTFVEGENLLYTVPEKWEIALERETKRQRMTALIPKKQRLEAWLDILNIQIIPGATSKSPVEFIAAMDKSAKQACPGSTGKVLEQGERDGYEYIIWHHHCENNPETKQMEISLLKATLGGDNFYVMQRAWRSSPSESELKDWQSYLNTTTLCDTRFKEVACPKVLYQSKNKHGPLRRSGRWGN